LVLEKLPLLLLSAASAVMTMKAQRAGNAVQTLSQYSFLLRAETAVISYVRYLGKAVWPSHLVALYPHPTKLYPVWQFAGAAVLLALITVLVLRARGQKYIFVGWFWFLGSLVPMIGLVQVGVQAMADRYAYIPFIGLFLMATWLAADVSKARWVVVPALACLLMLGLLTYRQVGYWHDTQAFWQRTLEFTSNNYVAETKLGEFLFSQHKDDEAASHFRAALAIRPDGLTANLNLGAYEDRRGNRTAAIERYQMVADHAGDIGLRATAYGSLGFVYRQQGDSRKARECFEIALQLAPDRSRAMVGLGLIAQDNGNLSEAIRHYSQAVAAQPTDVSYLLLAQALLRAGGASQANAIYEQLSHHPGLSQAQKDAEELLSQR
jgi:tetratricopeptide (TPR) repeat protein